MTIENCITKIIEKIPKGVMFDSHYVINQLIFHYHEEYLTFANNNTLSTHGFLAQEISKLKKLVKKQHSQSFSENINRKGSTCALWQKL